MGKEPEHEAFLIDPFEKEIRRLTGPASPHISNILDSILDVAYIGSEDGDVI